MNFITAIFKRDKPSDSKQIKVEPKEMKEFENRVYTESEIRTMLKETEAWAEQKFSIAELILLHPKLINVTRRMTGSRFETSEKINIDTVIQELQEYRDLGATHVVFESDPMDEYDDCYSSTRVVEIEFLKEHCEEDETHYMGRLKKVQHELIKKEINNLNSRVRQHNRNIKKYLDLKQKFEGENPNS